MKTKLLVLSCLFVNILLAQQPTFQGLIAHYDFEQLDEAAKTIENIAASNLHANAYDISFVTKDEENNALAIGEAISNSFLSINEAFDESPLKNLEGFTFSFWFKKVAQQQKTSTFHPLVTIQDVNGLRYILSYKTEDQSLRLAHRDYKEAYFVMESKTNLQDDVWYHLTFSIDPDEELAQLHVNGLLEAKQRSTIHLPDRPQILIGRSTSNLFSNFPMYYDDIRIFNRSLPEEEIIELAELDIEKNEMIAGQLKAFPNPVVGKQLTVQVRNAPTYYMQLVNAAGQVVQEGTRSGKEQLNLSDLPSGIYTLNVRNGDWKQSNKIIIP